MIRLILVVIFIILFLLIGCIPAFILWIIGKKRPDLKDRAARKIVRFAFRVILFLSGTKVEAQGLENIPLDGAALYVGNHRSYFDIVISYCFMPGITGYVSKKEMNRIPLLRIWMRYIHCLFLDRENIKEGLKTIQAGIEEVKTGISLWIFPEGTRSSGDEGTMLPFKEGSLRIAERGGCPVVPTAIAHSADVLESHFPFIRKTKVTIRFGEPIDIKSLPREQKKFAGAYVQNIVQGMLDDILKA